MVMAIVLNVMSRPNKIKASVSSNSVIQGKSNHLNHLFKIRLNKDKMKWWNPIHAVVKLAVGLIPCGFKINFSTKVNQKGYIYATS